MSKPKYKNQRDGNHSDIVTHLEAHGVTVTDCSAQGELPDLLTLYSPFKKMDYGRAGWVEVKMLRDAKFTWKQLNWIANTKWPVIIATDKDAALDFAKFGHGALHQSQKDNLAVELGKVTDRKKKLFTPGQVKAMLGDPLSGV
jgi:hypothetical protein